MTTQMTENSPNIDPQVLRLTQANKNLNQPGRRRGKIASLPADKRDLINGMLENGATYAGVVAEMAKHGISLNLQNLSNWFHSGFQDYIARREWLTQIKLSREEAADLPNSSDPGLHQAVLQVGVLKIFQSLKSGFATSDPVNDVRQLNTLARLSRLSAQVKKQAEAGFGSK